MATKVAELYAEVTARTDKLEASLKTVEAKLNSTKATAQKAGGGINDAFSQLTGISLGPVAALTAVGAGLKYAVDQAAEAEQVMAQTKAVIKSTGGAAGLTAEQISDMAEALSQSTTFADDAIQKGQNLLLTFTNIGKDVFPDATQAMLDMATAMGTDASGGAIQLGKALNDPTQGITALTRVGVTFTDEQKKQIKAMQEMGDVAGAQKIILAELNKEFGGSAAAAANTYAGKMTLLKNNFDNLAETVGGDLIPVLSDAADALNLLLTWNDKVTAALDEHEAATFETAQTYAEYREEMLRANEAAGRYEMQTVRLSSAGRGQSTVTQKVIDDTNIMSEALWNASQSAGEDERRIRDLSLATLDLGSATDEAAQKQLELESATGRYSAIAGQAVENELAAYQDKQRETGVSLAEVKNELDKLLAVQGKSYTVVTDATVSQAEYELALQKSADAAQALADNTDPDKTLALTVAAEKAAEKANEMADGLGGVSSGIIDNSEKIEELKGKYGDLQAAYAANAEAHNLATRKIILGYLEQQLAADGLSQAEIGYLLDIGEQWGVYGDNTKKIWDATVQTIKDGALDADETMRTLGAQFPSYFTDINRSINYDVHVTGNVPYGAEPGGEAPVNYGAGGNETVPASGGYASGGMAYGPMSGHWELLHGNERVLSPEQTRAYNSGQGGGGGEVAALLRTLPALIARSVRDGIIQAAR